MRFSQLKPGELFKFDDPEGCGLTEDLCIRMNDNRYMDLRTLRAHTLFLSDDPADDPTVTRHYAVPKPLILTDLVPGERFTARRHFGETRYLAVLDAHEKHAALNLETFCIDSAVETDFRVERVVPHESKSQKKAAISCDLWFMYPDLIGTAEARYVKELAEADEARRVEAIVEGRYAQSQTPSLGGGTEQYESGRED